MLTRLPQFAGTFYPEEPEVLRQMINGFLRQISVEKLKKKPKAIIVPHAGLIYSGPIAAYGYKTVCGFNYQTIILVGPSHNFYFEGMVSSPFKKWLTPLGEINSLTIDDFPILKENKIIKEVIEGHQLEHSLEVQIPFIQEIFGEKNFVIFPLLTGEINYLQGKEIIDLILDESALLIVSSDLSHYLSFEDALKQDKVTIDAILNLDIERFLEYGEACGKIPVAILLALAKDKGWNAKLLKSANSGETQGGKKQVVGYASIVFM